MLIEHFDVDVDRVMFVDEALERMRETPYDLVLFNRLIFADRSEGIELVHRARSDTALNKAPLMMVSNFDNAQDACVAAGGVQGFGKKAVFEPETAELLSQYLARKADT